MENAKIVSAKKIRKWDIFGLILNSMKKKKNEGENAISYIFDLQFLTLYMKKNQAYECTPPLSKIMQFSKKLGRIEL